MIPPRVHEKVAAFLERYDGMARERLDMALRPYGNVRLSAAALRKAWYRRAKDIARPLAERERTALQQFLGKRLHVGFPRRKR